MSGPLPTSFVCWLTKSIRHTKYDLCFQGLCGNIIDEALSVICGKNGYAGKNHKRSVEFDPGKFMGTP